ncbi:hypothetical protein XP2010_00855 [Xanthomonas perforans]|nr:hypothetical protein XP2010_00855 [Xanthomonas perforans]
MGQRSIRDFRRSVMAISVATLLSAQAYAQDATTTATPASAATTQQLDTVQVTGTRSGSVAKIVKLEHAWRRLDGRNDDGFQVAPFPG